MVTYKIYKSITELPESWDRLPHGDIFLSTAFLGALERSCPKNISPYYVGFFKADKLVGLAIVQRVEMYLDDIFRKTSNNSIKQVAKKTLAKIVKGNALIIGNLMHTGQHSLFFIEEELSYSNYLEILAEAMEALRKSIKKEFKKKIRIIAFKDYFEDDKIHEHLDFFKANKLYKVQVQPNMLLEIRPEWRSTEDYIATFTKKYKRRFKTARKKADALHCYELDEKAVLDNQAKIFELYKNVSDNARVNSFILAETHFSSLKETLKEDFKIFGYFLNEELIGFYSLILNGEHLETYFLGYKQELQYEHQMYLNMLYDMACFAIENNFKSVVYARTAMEIKSSVGAKANTMHVYMKHTNNIVANTLLKLIVKYMNPTRTWIERNPFK